MASLLQRIVVFPMFVVFFAVFLLNVALECFRCNVHSPPAFDIGSFPSTQKDDMMKQMRITCPKANISHKQ